MKEKKSPPESPPDVASLRRRNKELARACKEDRQSLQESEDSRRRLEARMTRLHDVINDLSKAPTFDSLCQHAVELGRVRLGFDRLGLWFASEDRQVMLGSYGTDEHGGVRDEKHRKLKVSESGLPHEFLTKRVSLAKQANVSVLNAQGREMGVCTRAAAALWDGKHVLGYLCCDDLIRQEGITDARCELLRLYASSLGHLCTRRRAEDALRESRKQECEFRSKLLALHEVTNALTGARTFYELCRHAVRLGTERLGLDRMSLWFTTDDPMMMTGSVGTDELGNLRDERNESADVVPNSLMHRVLTNKIHLATENDAEIFGHGGKSLGIGTRVLTPLWNGMDVIGYLATDNLLRHEEITEARGELQRVYASALGHLCSLKRAEEALRQSEERLRAVLASMRGTVVIVLDREGKYTHIWSSEEIDLEFGMPGADLVGKSSLGFLSPEQVDQRLKDLAQVFETGVPVSREYPFQAPSGERWCDIVLSPMRDSNGKVVAAVGVVRNITERKLAAEALRQNEQRLRGVLEASHDSIYMRNLRSGKYEYVSPSARDLTGFTAKEFASMDFDEMEKRVHPEDATKHSKHFDNLTEVRADDDFAATVEYRWMRQDGEYRWFSDSRALVRDSGGLPHMIVGSVRDVTERKRAEEQLRESEEKYRAVVESAVEAICTMDCAGEFLFLNSTAARDFGGSPEDIVGKKMHDLFPTETADRQLASVRGVIETGQGVSVEGPTIVAGENRWYNTNIQPLRDRTGEISSALIIAHDMTEQREAEKALRESEQKMRLIVEHSSDGINITEYDPKADMFRLVTCNSRYVEMTGRSREELLAAENLNDFATIHASPREMREYRKKLEQLQPYQGRASWHRPDGKENYYEWTAAPIQVGDKLYIIGVDRDITERTRSEAALRSAHRQLMSAREIERKYLASELHDSLGQGLVALQMTLRASLGDDGKSRALDALSDIRARCDDLVREVRNICHGLYPPTLESMGLETALRQIARDFDSQTEVIVQCPKSLGVRRLSSSVEIALFRIAQEAVTNAVRHGKAKRVEVMLACPSGLTALSVTDNGVGFDPEAAKGKGLGLTTIKERARAIGGQLRIESRPGLTTVSVHVPADAQPPEPEDS